MILVDQSQYVLVEDASDISHPCSEEVFHRGWQEYVAVVQVSVDKFWMLPVGAAMLGENPQGDEQFVQKPALRNRGCRGAVSGVGASVRG
mgnify:CR=1 FL=1